MGTGRVIGRVLAGASLAVLLATVVAAPAIAAKDDKPTWFRLNLSVVGNYTVDYGPDPGPNTSDYSGDATTSYSTDIVAVDRYRRGRDEIGGSIFISKTRVSKTETTEVVSHFPGTEPFEFECDNGRGRQVSGTSYNLPDTDLVGPANAGFVGDIGSVGISGDPGDAKEISYTVSGGAYLGAECFDAGHGPVDHYLHSPDTSSVMLGDQTLVPCCTIPRGGFNPNSDRKYSDSFSRNVHFDLGSNPHPGPFPNHPGADFPHVFDGSSEVSFKVKRVREGKAKRLRKKIRKLPNGSE